VAVAARTDENFAWYRWLHDEQELRRVFQEMWNRPPPWFELVNLDDLQPLVSTLSTRLKLPTTADLRNLLDAAYARFPFPSRDSGAEYGTTERPSIAFPRFDLPSDGTVYVYERGPEAIHMRTRDLIQFEPFFFRDDTWLLDEDGDWILFAQHDWPAYALKA
jgi:hypothetical protein